MRFFEDYNNDKEFRNSINESAINTERLILEKSLKSYKQIHKEQIELENITSDEPELSEQYVNNDNRKKHLRKQINNLCMNIVTRREIIESGFKSNYKQRTIAFKNFLVASGYDVTMKKDSKINFSFYSSQVLSKYLETICSVFEDKHPEITIFTNQNHSSGMGFFHEIVDCSQYRGNIHPSRLGADGIAMLYGLES